MRWGWLYVEVFWVAEHLRCKGHGSRLLQGAETFARSRDGVAIHLETGGLDALAFYEKRGYEIVGIMEGFPPGTRQHFMRKWLRDHDGAA